MEILNENEVLKNLVFEELMNFEDYKNISSKSMGVYILFNEKKEPLYIGKSNQLKNRLSQHFRGDHNIKKSENIKEETKYMTYCEIPSELEMDIYETIIISYLKPIYNSDKLYETERTSIKEIMKSIGREHKKYFDISLEEFIIKFFKLNKGVEVSVQTLKLICENNGFKSNGIGTCFSLTKLRDSEITFKHGHFRYR